MRESRREPVDERRFQMRFDQHLPGREQRKQNAAGPQHARQFRDDDSGFGDVFHHLVADDGVEAVFDKKRNNDEGFCCAEGLTTRQRQRKLIPKKVLTTSSLPCVASKISWALLATMPKTRATTIKTRGDEKDKRSLYRTVKTRQ